MNRCLQIFALLSILSAGQLFSQDRFTINGRVVSSVGREPVGYATVFVKGFPEYYAVTDSTGAFVISGVKAGIFKLESSCVGYFTETTSEYIISASVPFIEIEMEEDIAMLNGVIVRSSVLERSKDSGVGKQIIGVADIEKIPGGNRDISRVIRSYPGVSYSPVGYRNDLIVRGGGPSENAFYIDGIEIPNINHFSTQGASGGPVGIVNSDLIEQVQFYTGAIPVEFASVLSSVMDISLKNGDPYKTNFKGTVGASEVGVSGNGHIGKNTTYLYSLRQSYLQVLFKFLGLPFLPNYIDGLVKVKHRISSKSELSFIALGAIDKMKLNTEEKGEEVEYMLSYLPVIKQNTYTIGASYTYYGNNNRLNIAVSYSHLYNSNIKYLNNDDSSPENLIYSIRSNENKLGVGIEDAVKVGRWRLLGGMKVKSNWYDNKTEAISKSQLNFYEFSAYFSSLYTSYNKKFTARIGLKAEGASYSSKMLRFWNQFSPRAVISYRLFPKIVLNGSSGIYHQLPPLTALGYISDGLYPNKGLSYMKVFENSLGFKWNICEPLVVGIEGFYKVYKDMPLSVTDGIPLACKGNDYGIVGNELLVSGAKGNAYGLEASVRWQIPGKLNLIGSFTLYNSQYKSNEVDHYYPSAWDNRFILNCGATYNFVRNWSIGAKLSCIGGAPYTPYDLEKSSLKEYWDKRGKAYYDYSRYNTLRLDPFAQLDIRVDKSFYFRRWMLGLYIDIQNVTGSKLKLPDALMSTGAVENPDAPLSEQKYIMKYIVQSAGSVVPTIGISVEF